MTVQSWASSTALVAMSTNKVLIVTAIWYALYRCLHLESSTAHLIILVFPVVADDMLLHQKLLDDCIVDGVHGFPKSLIELDLCG